MKSYSHDAAAAANLLAAHRHIEAAEQTYRLATDLWPENPEPVSGLAELFTRAGREDEARHAIEEFKRRFPKQQRDLERLRASWQATITRR